jgi:hypothetical protein
MFFIYAIELQEEAMMDNWKHSKRGKETYTRVLTLIYMTSCREIKGRDNIRERDKERDISIIHTRGDILTGGVILFPMMRKGEEEKEKRHGNKEKK